MVKIIVLNKTKGKEVGRMYLKSYFDKPDWLSHSNKEFMNGFSQMERKLAKRLDMVKIKGKGEDMFLYLLQKT